MKRFTFLATLMMLFFGLNAQVFITEIADPNNETGARYVELYNIGTTPVDLSTGWKLQRYTNGNATPQTAVDLTGTIPAGGFYIISSNETTFNSTYGFAPSQDIGTGGPADSNGDDQILLLDPSDAIIDIFGVPGEDGSGTAHEFEDGRAERVATVVTGVDTWDALEWNIDNDGGAGDGAIDAPDGYDPGAWIGEAPSGPTLVWDGTTFTESAGNDGTIGNQIELTLVNETFSISGGAVNLELGTHFTVANVPAGLTVSVDAYTSTAATIRLNGTADNHENIDDVLNLEITFTNAAFTGDDATSVANSSKTDLVVDFNDAPPAAILVWDAVAFDENIANDGTIGNTLSLSLTGETFVTVGSLVSGTDFIVANVPAGLTVEITTTTNEAATIALTGTADAHESVNSISNLEITFANVAFTGGDASIVADYSKTDLAVNFMDQASVTWNVDGLTEDVVNNGSFTTDITVSLINETFSSFGTEFTDGVEYTVANVPAGLTAHVTPSTATEASITLSGNADSHTNADDINNLTVTFLDAAFTGGSATAVLNSEKADLFLNFYDPFTTPNLVITEIMYNPPESGGDTLEFFEIYNNESFAVNLDGYYIDGANYVFGDIEITAGEYLVLAVNATAMMNTFGVTAIEWTSGGLSNGGENVGIYNPAGTPIDEVAYDDNVDWPNADGTGHSIVLCDFSADNALAENWTISTNYVGVNTDNNRLWASPAEADVVCSLVPVMDWSTTTFEESLDDNGTISTVVDLTLTDEAFTQVGVALTLGTDFYISNVPAGLTVEINTTSATAATIALTGAATSHVNADDISNMEITLTDTAFVSGFASNVVDASKTDLVVDFIDDLSVKTIVNNSVSIYPNPVKNVLTIEGENITSVEIMDINGKVVRLTNHNNSKESINVSSLKQGIYFVKVVTINDTKVSKLTKL